MTTNNERNKDILEMERLLSNFEEIELERDLEHSEKIQKNVIEESLAKLYREKRRSEKVISTYNTDMDFLKERGIPPAVNKHTSGGLSTDTKIIISFVCFFIGLFTLPIILGPIGIYFGSQAKNEGATKIPYILNIIITSISIFGFLFLMMFW